MADAINKIYTRMNRLGYKNSWIFSRPNRRLEPVTKDSWLQALNELISLTLLPVSDYNAEVVPLEISSDLDQDDYLEYSL